MCSSEFLIFLLSCFISFASVANSQLVGCDAVGCPGWECKVGNTSLLELGISQLNTSISSEPLTWTIGLQRIDDLASGQTLLDRDFFFGTPPSLQLTNSSSVRSCVLFFDGIADSLSFPGNISKGYTVGGCGDALGNSCVGDLLAQSQTEMGSILATSGQNWSESIICNKLEGKLLDNVPESCQLAHSQGWGTIHVRSLTGPEAASKIQQKDCHPTTGNNYDISLVSSTRFIAPLERPLASFVYGITPVMTIFYPYTPSTNLSNTSSETHLNCMKVIGSRSGEVGGAAGATGFAPERLEGSFIANIVTMFVIIMLF